MRTKKGTPPSQQLNIHLAVASVKKPADFFVAGVTGEEIELASGQKALFHMPPHGRGEPGWFDLFRGSDVGRKFDNLFTQSVSAAMVFEVDGRVVAASFGPKGRHLIDHDLAEDRFGLKTTLSSTDTVTSIETKTFDALSTKTVKQGSRSGEVTDYGVDIERDLLRAVTGVPTDPDLGTRLVGKDSLAATVGVDLAGIPEKVRLYIKQFLSGGYKKTHAWIDHIAEEKNGGAVKALSAKLIEKIKGGDTEKIWFTPPEILDWAVVQHFTYTADDAHGVFPELNISDWLGTVKDLGKLTLDDLFGRKVRWTKATTGKQGDEWPVYKTLHAEIDHDGTTYLLSEGKWFRVTPDFVKETDAAVEKLVVASTFPTYRRTAQGGTKAHEDEYDYNKEFVNADKSKYALLDQENVAHGGGPSKLEACDILDTSGTLTHVKRYNEAKDLSHLFMQGMHSAQTLMHDLKYRGKVNAKLPASHSGVFPSSGILEGKKYRVRFVVIREKSKAAKAASMAARLPFFSRLSLKRAADALRSVGIPVEIMHVDAE